MKSKKTTPRLAVNGNRSPRTRNEMMAELKSTVRGRGWKELDRYIHKKLLSAEERQFPDTSVRKFRYSECMKSLPEYYIALWCCTTLFPLYAGDEKKYRIEPSETNTFARVLPFTKLFGDLQNTIFRGKNDQSLSEVMVEFLNDTELLEVVGTDDSYGERRSRQIIVRLSDELKAVLKTMPIKNRRARATAHAEAAANAQHKRVQDPLTEYVKPQTVDIPAMRSHIIDNLHSYGVKKLIRFTTVAQRIESGEMVLNKAKTGRAYYNAENLPREIRSALFSGTVEIDISAAHLTIFNALTDARVDATTVYEKVEKKLRIKRSEAKIIVNSLLNGMRTSTAARKVREWGGVEEEILNCPELQTILRNRSSSTARQLQKIESDSMRAAIKELGYFTFFLHDAVLLRSREDCERFHRYLNIAAGQKFGIYFNTKIKELI